MSRVADSSSTFILGLLGLIVDVVRLTIDVMEKISQMKNDDNKKD